MAQVQEEEGGGGAGGRGGGGGGGGVPPAPAVGQQEEEEPQLQLDLQVAQNLQHQLNQESRLIMRYKQLIWGNRYFQLKALLSALTAVCFLLAQTFKQYFRAIEIPLFLVLLGYGVANTFDYVFTVRRVVPRFPDFRAHPQRFEALTKVHRVVRLALLGLAGYLIGSAMYQVLTLEGGGGGGGGGSRARFYVALLVFVVCNQLLVLVLYSVLITVFVTLWAVIGVFIFVYLLVSVAVWACSCGKLNLFKHCVPLFRRRQPLLMPRLARPPPQVDFAKLAADLSRKWKLHCLDIYQQDKEGGARSPGDAECSICLSPFEEHQEVVGLPCSPDRPLHFFHTQPCAAHWFRDHAICPMCRCDYSQKYKKP